MLIRRQSQLTGAMNTMEIPVTIAQIDHWQQSGELIQRAFPSSQRHNESS